MRSVLVVVAFLLSCSESKRAESQPEDEMPKTYTPRYEEKYKFEPSPGADAPWWCSTAQQGQFSTCDRLRVDCDLRRRIEIERGASEYEKKFCEPQVKAACFERKNKMTEKSERTCYASPTVCRNLSDSQMQSWKADWDVMSDCRIE